jgi:hypothetical protein
MLFAHVNQTLAPKRAIKQRHQAEFYCTEEKNRS